MEQISFKLEGFEGPMDLLLHLIGKHKLNINDIPIIELVDQYLDAVRSMQEADMEVASEFLEMAARLIYIKTVSLLPRHEEAETLKQELSGELIEYQACQQIAAKLAQQTEGFNHFVRPPQKMQADATYQRLHENYELLSAYLAAVGGGMKRLPPPVESFQALLKRNIVSISSQVSAVVRTLGKRRRVHFLALFEGAGSRSELVATFLAVLELAKEKKIEIESAGDDLQVRLRGEANTH